MTGISKSGQKGFQPKEVIERRKEAQKEHGYTYKNELDYINEQNEILLKYKLRDKNEKPDAFGLTDDFYKFIGIPKKGGRDFRIPLNETIQDKLSKDFASFYTPIDDFYGTPGGGDTVYDQGRVPVSHLMMLCAYRLGVAYRGCNSVANDVFRNRFTFVNYDDNETVVERPDILKWMRKTFFWSHMVDVLDFERRTGLGHLVSYWDFESKGKNVNSTVMSNKAPAKRPDSFQAFSCYYMTPNNIYDFDSVKLDYDKNKWDFTGGVLSQSNIHHSRVYPLETRRVEGGLRGIGIPELCWVPLICYLNTAYYILRSLSQLGVLTVGASVATEFPSPELVGKYLDVFDEMRANHAYVFGKGTEFKLENAASKIGEGISSYLEFLKEDISSAWIIPKNQLFGRSEGGGLDGAGALVSKEDYLASNLSTLQLNLTDDILYILQEHCHFTGMEELNIRWNLDLHKTEQQRLTEKLMREQLAQAEIQTDMVKLQSKMMKIQHEQAKLQWEQFQKEPSLLLPQQSENQPNEKKKVDEDKEVKPKPTNPEKKQSSPNQNNAGDFMPSEEEYNRWRFRMGLLSSFGNNLNDTNKNWKEQLDTIDDRIRKSQEKNKQLKKVLYGN